MVRGKIGAEDDVERGNRTGEREITEEVFWRGRERKRRPKRNRGDKLEMINILAWRN